MESIDLPTAGALGSLLGFGALLVRSLLKTDHRWERIVDEKDAIIEALSTERDAWRERYLRLIEEGHEAHDPPPPEEGP